MKAFARAWLPALVVLAAALAASSVLRGGYWWDSHEKYWYPVRFVEYLEAGRAGAWYPRWCPDLFGGYGYPFFNYYPPGVFAIASLPAALGFSPAASLKLAMVGFALAGGASAYGLARGETRRSDAALVAAVLFVALPYRSTDLLVRGDLAEYAALSLVPLALWTHRAFLRASERRAALVAVAAVLAHAAVILCHTLTGLFVTEVLGVMVVLSVLARWDDPPSRGRALAAGVVLTLGVGAASIYLLPAWRERWLVHLLSMTSGAYTTWCNFIPGRALVEPGRYSVGLPAALGVFAALLVLARAEARRRSVELLRWWAPAIGCAALMLAPVAAVWRHAPLGAFVQFPWRMLGLVGVFAATAIGVTWALAVPERTSAWLRYGLALAAAAAIFAVERPDTAFAPAISRARVPGSPAEIQALAKSSTVVDEYLPQLVFPVPRRPRTWAAKVVRGNASVESRSEPLAEELTIDAQEPAELDVARFWFPGWRIATLSGPAQAVGSQSPNGLYRVDLPQPGHYRVRVSFGSTPLRDGATALSALSLLLCWPLLRRLTRGTRGR